MRRSVVIAVLGLFLVVPLAYFLFVYSGDIPDSNIQGASTESLNQPEAGVTVYVDASAGTWDLYQYACANYDGCVDGLMSGVRLSTVGGGPVEDYEVVVSPSVSWEGNNYLKLFVKSGWGAASRTFNIVDLGGVEDTELVKITEDGVDYDVLIMPIDKISTKHFVSGRFSDL